MNKKRLLRTVLCLAMMMTLLSLAAQAVGGVAINEKNFPDQIFREYVAAQFDADSDGVLSAAEVEAAETVDLADTETADLTGLSSLVSLKELNVKNTRITALNISRNPSLETLDLSGCGIKSLDVSKNQALRELDAGGTGLTALNVSRNPALETLILSGCQLKSVDVAKNTALKMLDVTGTGISELNVSNNKALEVLFCGKNALEALDVTGIEALRELDCRDNRLAALDMTGNPALEILLCARNSLSQLNVSECRSLRELDCSDNALITLYLDGNSALEKLNCSKNRITELSVKKNPALEWLECGDNAISSLSLTGNRGLKHLSCEKNGLTKLNLSKNPELEWVECWGNDIHALDISYSNNLMAAYNYGSNEVHKSYASSSYVQNEAVYEIRVDSGVILQDGSVAAPLITAQPKDASAVKGKKITFTMNAVGEGLFFQWYYRQPGSNAWYPIKGETGRKLTVTADKSNNGCRYMCEVINRGGMEQTKQVRLTVILKPTITEQPANRSAIEGKKVSFQVVAKGEALTYQWYRLAPNATEWEKVKNGTSAKLTVTANAARNGTRYRCVVSNEAGKVTSSEAKLTTILPPAVTKQPADAHVKKGDYATFTVKASGGALKYQWYMKFKGDKDWTLMPGETGRTLKVRATPKRDRSIYRCRISNAAGHVYSDAVKLYLQ